MASLVRGSAGCLKPGVKMIPHSSPSLGGSSTLVLLLQFKQEDSFH
jgi:hypothetical protein